MKTNVLKFAGILLLTTTLTSCKLAYQVFTVQPTEKTVVDSAFVFSNGDLEIGYSFWANGGVMDYYILNKTDKPIYINWDRSHFVLNTFSRDYYGKNQNFTYDNLTEVVKLKKVKAPKAPKAAKMDSTAVAKADSTAVLAAAAPAPVEADKAKKDTTKKEAKKKAPKRRKIVYSGSVQHSNQLDARAKAVVEIPGNARVLSSDFNFIDDVQNDKKLKLGMFRCKRSKLYDQSESPYKLRNYITYSFSNNFTGAKVVDNEFYVSEITSLTANKFLGQRVKTKRITSSLNKRQFLFDLPYYSKSAFFVRNPEFIKIIK